jgi:hypothetical protein
MMVRVDDHLVETLVWAIPILPRLALVARFCTGAGAGAVTAGLREGGGGGARGALTLGKTLRTA